MIRMARMFQTFTKRFVSHPVFKAQAYILQRSSDYVSLLFCVRGKYS